MMSLIRFFGKIFDIGVVFSAILIFVAMIDHVFFA